MSTRIKSAMKNRPKKPLNAYFKARLEKFAEYGDKVEDKNTRFKEYWEGLPDKEKDQMKKEYHEDLESYKDEHTSWLKKYGISEDDVKKYNKE